MPTAPANDVIVSDAHLCSPPNDPRDAFMFMLHERVVALEAEKQALHARVGDLERLCDRMRLGLGSFMDVLDVVDELARRCTLPHFQVGVDGPTTASRYYLGVRTARSDVLTCARIVELVAEHHGDADVYVAVRALPEHPGQCVLCEAYVELSAYQNITPVVNALVAERATAPDKVVRLCNLDRVEDALMTRYSMMLLQNSAVARPYQDPPAIPGMLVGHRVSAASSSRQRQHRDAVHRQTRSENGGDHNAEVLTTPVALPPMYVMQHGRCAVMAWRDDGAAQHDVAGGAQV